ncbi:MAG: DUF2905 domain-containing protein [Schwartzia sp.]|jgi:hypothetical protein|nr:DUF2905 domain-containing protein [Schwartzia sp. (in: firmicutes)]
MDAQQIGRTMMIFGALLLAVGAFFYFGGRLFPLGQLPGDFHFGGENWSVHFPLATCAIISIVLSLLLNLFFRR